MGIQKPSPLGQCHQLKEKCLPSHPKGFPLRGSCLRSRLKRCPRYTSFVYYDRRSYRSVYTSSEPLRREASPLGRGPPSPPRGRLLETAQLKLMTLPLRGSCLRSRLKRCPPMFRSSVAIDEPCTAGTPLPPRCAGHLPLKGKAFGYRSAKLMTLPFRGRWPAP